MAPAVTKMLASDAGTSHFQAKPISWSMRTRGSVPRMSTKNSDQADGLAQEPEQADDPVEVDGREAVSSAPRRAR